MEDEYATEDEIRIIAYGLWQDEGCCDGRDVEHWVRAEAICRNDRHEATGAGKSRRSGGRNGDHQSGCQRRGRQSSAWFLPAPLPAPGPGWAVVRRTELREELP